MMLLALGCSWHMQQIRYGSFSKNIAPNIKLFNMPNTNPKRWRSLLGLLLIQRQTVVL